jgi:hypothetical protein
MNMVRSSFEDGNIRLTMINNNVKIFNGGARFFNGRWLQSMKYIAAYNNTMTQVFDSIVPWTTPFTLPMIAISDAAGNTVPVDPPVIYQDNNTYTILPAFLPITNYAPLNPAFPVELYGYLNTLLLPNPMPISTLPICSPSQEALVVRNSQNKKMLPFGKPFPVTGDVASERVNTV